MSTSLANPDIIRPNSEVDNTSVYSDSNSTRRKDYGDTDIQFVLAASECNYAEILRMLKDDPTLVSLESPFDGYTALHYACKFNDSIIVKNLIGNYNANVNVISKSGKTPLHVAVEFGNLELARNLICHYNADKNIIDYYGRKPVECAPPELEAEAEKILGIPEWKKYIPVETKRGQSLDVRTAPQKCYSTSTLRLPENIPIFNGDSNSPKAPRSATLRNRSPSPSVQSNESLKKTKKKAASTTEGNGGIFGWFKKPRTKIINNVNSILHPNKKS